ncbi:pentapeptide repeat-containing protein [Rhizobium oryzicola]|uniref:Pentapeptide repeat-containing protein n=1 Tax=Rhizobium oryzicola TaxID=1232668 RepID=A0ABT8ST48_9HYPH|nr:pentapeptide repeat-containing protein [Rhizobium oryzicola]MDO1581597.1 pentapeptide repeat-containing protein [Rhizobium oryzicola]
MKTLSGDRWSGKLRANSTGAMALATAITLSYALTGFSVEAGDCRREASSGVDWSSCKKRLLMLGGSDFKGANLAETDFSMTDLSRTDMTGAVLEKATTIRAYIAGASMVGANFNKVEGYRSDFTEAKADKATFVAAELQRVSFVGASLVGADFSKAELGRADFRKSIMGNTSFRLANLSRADLRDIRIQGSIDLSGAVMFRTRIDGMDLKQVKGLSQTQVDLACGDKNTVLPPGLNRPEDWECGEE